MTKRSFTEKEIREMGWKEVVFGRILLPVFLNTMLFPGLLAGFVFFFLYSGFRHGQKMGAVLIEYVARRDSCKK